MARLTVYWETSVITYAASRPSRDLIVAAHQQITRQWFSEAADRYDLLVSQLVVDEAMGGDAEAAKARGALIEGMPQLAVSNAAAEPARTLVEAHAVPRAAVEDALHIAIAAVNGASFLLTWNCRHIANAARRQVIEAVCRRAGYEPPVICTPEELSDEEPP